MLTAYNSVSTGGWMRRIYRFPSVNYTYCGVRRQMRGIWQQTHRKVVHFPSAMSENEAVSATCDKAIDNKFNNMHLLHH